MISVKKLRKEDLEDIASIHQSAFAKFFLTSLGNSFLKMFYSSIIDSNQGISLGAFYENKLVGFAVGAQSKSGFYKNLLIRNFIPLALSASVNLLKSPRKIKTLIQTLLSSESAEEKYMSYATLLSICVSPEKKGQKVGKLLLEAFEIEVLKYNTGVSLTTDSLNNEYVNKFYSSNHYVLVNQYKQGKREMNFYVKKLK